MDWSLPSVNKNNPSLQPYYWILISGFTFSWMAALAPLANKGCGWQVVALARCAVPLILVTIWAKMDGVKLVFWGTPVLWLRSIAGSCSLVGTFYAFGIPMPLTDIYTIANVFPIWVALLSWPMLGRFPSPAVWISIVCSIVGVAVIQGADVHTGQYGALIIVAVSMFSAVAMMGLNRLKDVDPRAVVVHFSATAFVFALVCVVVFPMDAAKEVFELRHGLELLGVGITASFGQYFLTRAFTSGDPAKVSVASLSQFVFILVLDVCVVGNPLDPTKLWGIPLILGPTLWLMVQRVKPAPLAIEPALGVQSLPKLSCEANLAICADSAIASVKPQ